MSDFSQPTECRSIAFASPTAASAPFTIVRRACGPNDIVIDIKFAGICHSDIHNVREEWGKGIFPQVPGHEIGGVVVAVGSAVTSFALGEHAGVGCMVDSCRTCRNCAIGNEQYCQTGCVYTYNARFKYAIEPGAVAYGGYSKHIVVDKAFALKIPMNLDLAAATPLLCAGITLYSPMIHYGVKPDTRFGIAGLGGLGHMGVKFGAAFGCHTTVISRGPAKREHAINDLGANAFIDSSAEDEMNAAERTFDIIISTISAPYNMNAYLKLLKTDGKLVVVGAPPGKQQVSLSALIDQRREICGSLIGGVAQTQEMLDFCGRHNITCMIEKINADAIDVAYDRAVASDVKYRFVIDTASF